MDYTNVNKKYNMNTEINKFLEKYNTETDIVQKLTLMYDFIDNSFEKSAEDTKVIINQLLVIFNDPTRHLSELKTALLISKPFKEDPIIKENRMKLLKTYNEKAI